MIWLKLFWDFFRVSCFTFGGAYGAIPLIRDMVLRNGWLSEERLSDMIAVSESTPGPIMVNLATYIGSDRAGFLGSLIATAAVVLPAYLVILLVVGILKNAIDHPWVQAVLGGLKPCVTGIVLATGLAMVLRNGLPGLAAAGWRDGLITLVLAGILLLWQRLRKKKLSPIALICISGLLGAAVYGF